MLVAEVEVESLRVTFGRVEGDIFDLGGALVAAVVKMEVDDLELEEGVIV